MRISLFIIFPQIVFFDLMNKPRIAVVNAGPIGMFTTTFRALSLLKHLTNEFEVHFIVSFNKEDRQKYGKEFNGIKIHYITDFRARARKFNPLFIYRIFKGSRERFKLLEKIHPSIIHVFKPLPIGVIPARKYAKKYSIPFVLDIDDAEYEMGKASGSVSFSELLLIKHFEEKAPFWCDYLTTASKYFYDKYISKKRLAYITNGVDPQEFKGINPAKVKEEYGLNRRKALLYLGSMLKCFDPDLAIEAFSSLNAKKGNLVLLMVGSGPHLPELKKMAELKGLANSVIFTGEVPHERIPSILSASDVLIFPLRDNYINECRCPVKIREYMLSGVPIAAFAVGEAKIALNGVAKLSKPGNMKEFSKNINSLLENKKESKQLAERASSKAIKEYTWKKLSLELKKVYYSFK